MTILFRFHFCVINREQLESTWDIVTLLTHKFGSVWSKRWGTNIL